MLPTCEHLLESYVGIPGPDTVYFYRGVNNARSSDWLVADGRSALRAVWIDPNGNVAYRVYDHMLGVWYDSAVESRSCGGADWAKMNPVITQMLSGDQVAVAWLESDGAWHNPSYCIGATSVRSPGSLGTRPLVTAFGPIDYPVLDGRLKYLCAAPAGPLVFGVTKVVLDLSTPETDTIDKQAMRIAGGRSGRLLANPRGTSVRASDPTVSTSPDGTVTVFAWEEQIGPKEKGDSPVGLFFTVTRRPAPGMGASSVEGPSCGDSHCCAVTVGGHIECWGYNYDGESDPPPLPARP